MRSLTLVLVAVLTACVTTTQPRTLTLEQLRQNTVTQADCPRIEELVRKLEQNQLNVGIPRMPPELLAEPEREYQALTRINIWALRIGCNNPNRYG